MEHLLTQVPLLVARYGGNEGGELQERLRTAIRVHQCSGAPALAGQAFAAVLERMAVFGQGIRVRPALDKPHR
jgi:hypothetical protein